MQSNCNISRANSNFVGIPFPCEGCVNITLESVKTLISTMQYSNCHRVRRFEIKRRTMRSTRREDDCSSSWRDWKEVISFCLIIEADRGESTVTRNTENSAKRISTRTIEKSFKIPTYDRIHKHVLSIEYLLNLKEYRSKIKEDDCSKSD